MLITPNYYSMGHIRPPAIIAQINPLPGSRFSCYRDIIRLDNTGIMGLSSALGLANRFSEHTRSEKKSYKKKTLACNWRNIYIMVYKWSALRVFITPGKNKTVLGKTANTIPVAGVTWLRIRFRFPIRVEKDTYSLYYCQEKSGRWTWRSVGCSMK